MKCVAVDEVAGVEDGREYLRVEEGADGVAGGDNCVFGVADSGGGGAAVRVCAVLAVQPGVAVESVHLALAWEGWAARGGCGGCGFQGGACIRGGKGWRVLGTRV